MKLLACLLLVCCLFSLEAISADQISADQSIVAVDYDVGDQGDLIQLESDAVVLEEDDVVFITADIAPGILNVEEEDDCFLHTRSIRPDINFNKHKQNYMSTDLTNNKYVLFSSWRE